MSQEKKHTLDILLVGHYGGGPYRIERVKQALEYYECNVIPFDTGKYFNRSTSFKKHYRNLKLKSLFGRELQKIKADLIHKIIEVRPDIVFYRDVLLFKYVDWRDLTEFSPHISICNVEMDMFSEGNNTYAWNQFRKSLKLFDLHFVFRKKNIKDFRDIGYKYAYLWEPSFIPWYHKLPGEFNEGKFYSDAVFVGHYENDGRKEYCEYLYKKGIDIKIYSTNWKKFIKNSNPLYNCLHDPIYGDKYPQAVYASKASLCFFSRLNNDELTERVFEIPAMGGLLVAERNERLKEIFEEGKEVLLFSSKEELLEHILFIKRYPEKAHKIKKAGREKVIKSHSIFNRAVFALKIIQDFIAKNVNNY
ncbi:MAG: glycosyltransferase family 1 protein [Bacteroidetes bacterium]|nr:glycosyltransferase family 1 protein [Bacteroidota bacterium]